MDLSFLPAKIFLAMQKCKIEEITEIRLRENFNIKIKAKNNLFYLSDNGLSILDTNALKCIRSDIEYIIKSVTEHSIYAFNDKIKNGFLTTKDGIRIGLAGECVTDNEQVITLKNFTSLNVRIPHEIIGCSNKIFDYIYQNHLLNTLIISPPLFGKTTLLKDLIRKLNLLNTESILVVDERGEFNKINGENVDFICYSNKKYAFENGIRSLAPTIIITDEIANESDWTCIKNASLSGVKVIASCHGCSLSDIVEKNYYKKNIFERYIVLRNYGQAGVIDKVYDKNYREL